MRVLTAALLAAALGLASTPAAAESRANPGAGVADFSGADLGIDLGAVMGTSGAINTSGLAAGVHAGYNLQNGPVVGGIYGNVLFGNVSGGSANSDNFTFNSLGSLRGRAGYAMGDLLFFGSLGWAFSGAQYANLSGSSSQYLGGWVLGAGAEMAITHNVTLRAELSHYDFGNVNWYMPSGLSSVSTSQNMITLGVATHF